MRKLDASDIADEAFRSSGKATPEVLTLIVAIREVLKDVKYTQSISARNTTRTLEKALKDVGLEP